jgi:hypothetical protein
MNEPDPPDARPADLAALADLDADLPDPQRAAHGRAAAAADPDAAAVLDALAATRAELAALPAPDVPPDVAARWTAALAAEAAAPDPATTDVGTTAPHRHTGPRRGPGGPANRLRAARGGSGRIAGAQAGPGRRAAVRPAWPALLAAAALAAVVGTGLGALVQRPAAAPTVTRVELVALGRTAVGTLDVGDLADPARRAACLRAVAPEAAGETLLGGRRVVLDGRPGVLLVLATGVRGGLRILTVDAGCGPAGGTLVAQVVVA